MKEFLDFFELMPPHYKTIFLMFSLGFCWVLEYSIPLFKFKYSKLKHGRINIYFLLIISVINFVFGLFLVVGLDYFHQFNLGLLQWLDLPVVVELIVAFLALDFVAQYVIHICLHKFSWMWKFHLIHHSDRFLDATSGTRHHPIDYALREVFSIENHSFLIDATGPINSKYVDIIKDVMIYTYDSVTNDLRDNETNVKKQLTILKSKKETIEERYAIGEIDYALYEKIKTKYE